MKTLTKIASMVALSILLISCGENEDFPSAKGVVVENQYSCFLTIDIIEGSIGGAILKPSQESGELVQVYDKVVRTNNAFELQIGDTIYFEYRFGISNPCNRMQEPHYLYEILSFSKNKR